ncbi:MAG TPA: type II toxin-antitoxin system VapC family toxin [Terriglobales bacterium]|nr:type II toxin-antitoxin system VapC family toxin [Terriglobales bacterium]
MTRVPGFWDASALVPLCIHESTSRQAHSHLRHSLPVVWWGSAIEVQRAVMRLHRFGKVKDVEVKGALARLDLLRRGWREILPTDALRESALQLLEKHDLRAADSLQLAAALTWCKQRPSKRTFICADQRLSRAAQAIGFPVLFL